MRANGGLTKGKSHAKGGIDMVVKSTGQKIEVEGGEGIINKHVMSDDKKYDFEGKEMTACEISSNLNQRTGNGVKFSCEETKHTDMTPTDPTTGFGKGGEVPLLRGSLEERRKKFSELKLEFKKDGRGYYSSSINVDGKFLTVEMIYIYAINVIQIMNLQKVVVFTRCLTERLY